MAKLASRPEIRAKPSPTCTICGGDGKFIHLDQPDRMFGAPGLWNLKQCMNEQCRLIWLDPMPVEEDIDKAYARYYTHRPPNSVGQASLLARFSKSVKRGILAREYGYTSAAAGFLPPFIKALFYMIPHFRAAVDGSVRFLPAVERGRLLDIGCGSGEWLLVMRELGWEVNGVDLDERAVKLATANGLSVSCGTLDEHVFPPRTFDAVTLNHVIEHVPDPVATLRECARILKPGGKLVLFTPNGSSLGHRIFKDNWRGLEPPRHLHIFSIESIRKALHSAGFESFAVLPWIGQSLTYESYLLRRNLWDSGVRRSHQWPAKFFAAYFSAAEALLIKWRPSFADCVAAIAVK